MDRREQEDALTRELDARHLQDDRTSLDHKDDADQRQKEHMASHQARHRKCGAESECARIANDHARGMHVEPEEANESTGNQCADDRKIHLPWCIQQCNDHVADPGKCHRSTREAIEAIGQVDPVARRNNRDDCNGDP